MNCTKLVSKPLSTLAIAAAILAAAGVPSSLLHAATGDSPLQVPEGFRAELVYQPALADQGSWVSMTVDERGRLIASDQEGALYRLTPAPLGKPASQTKVEKIPLAVGMAQGLLVHQGHLYVMLNGMRGAITSGLYRLTDTDDDDQYDRVEQLRVWQGLGEHGPHAVIASPDGKSLYVCSGNQTRLPLLDGTLVPNHWRDDRLLPPLFAVEIASQPPRVPGGWIGRIDLETEELQLVAVGFRNEYDIAFNEDGELFTFDADAEGDNGMPWYRPTRVCHVPSGVDFGWRDADGKWDEHAIDSLPAAVNVGPGSPTGITFGAGTKFPAPYDRAMFAGDWALGKIYAIHLRPEGAGYGGEVETFSTGTPLAVTDLVVRPQDGALYVVVGGRKSQSAVYRIWHTGAAVETDVAAVEPAARAAAEKARALRHELEAFHAGPDPAAVEKLWPHLASEDPVLRSAARIALEHQPIEAWGERALNEPDPRCRIAALAALARVGSPALAKVWTASLTRLPWDDLPVPDRRDVVRTAALGVMRLEPSAAVRQQLIAWLNPRFPAEQRQLNQELATLLTELQAPDILPRLLEMLASSTTYGEGVAAVRPLSVISSGWTIAQRRAVLEWFDNAAGQATAGSFRSLEDIRKRFITTLTAAEQRTLRQYLDRAFAPSSSFTTGEPRPFVQEWTVEDAVAAIEAAPQPRDRENGRKLFGAAQCFQCHAIGGEGAAVGPQLDGAAQRFSLTDLMRSMIEPSYAISDQYQQTLFMVNGMAVVGRVGNLDGDKLMVAADPMNPYQYTAIPRDEIDDQRPSEVSPMPTGLLNTLTGEEIADLVEFLKSP